MKRLVKKIFVALARYLEVDFVVVRQVSGGSGQDGQSIWDNPIPTDKNVGLVSLFGGGFSAGGPGAFVGSLLGTLLACNVLPAGFLGNYIDAQVAGVPLWGVSMDGGVQPGAGFNTAKTGNRIYFVTGVPVAGLGQNGDFALRSDGVVTACLYQKRAGAWVATAA